MPIPIPISLLSNANDGVSLNCFSDRECPRDRLREWPRELERLHEGERLLRLSS